MVMCVAFLVALSSLTSNLVIATDRPIIGIVSHELVGFLKSKFPFYDAYISASYVKAVESSGARVVPIMNGQSKAYYRKMFDSVNGVLIPGGATFFNGTGNYYSTGKLLYELAMQVNDGGVSFPILGICLGFELLVYLANDEIEIRHHCERRNVNLPLQFEPNFKKSSLFRHTPPRILRTLQTNVTINYHQWCIYPKDFRGSQKLDSNWRILSTSPDPSKSPFISSMEHKKYPIAGVQFHPSRHSFEWSAKKSYPHTLRSIEAGRHFFDWLVNQSTSNNHSFVSAREESLSLIYNYSPVYSDQYNVSYLQMYLFKTQWSDDINATLT